MSQVVDTVQHNIGIIDQPLLCFILNNMVKCLALLLYIWEVLGLNLDLETGYAEVFLSTYANAREIPYEYVNDIPTQSCHIKVVQNVDNTTLIATSYNPVLLVCSLKAYLSRLELCGIGGLPSNISKSTTVLFVKATRCIQKPKQVQFPRQPIQCTETARYLGVTLNTQLTWSVHVNHVGKKAAQRLAVLGPFLHRRSGLTVINGMLLYKQIIHPMMDYTCLIWRLNAHTHIQMLQVLQSKCLHIVTNAHWCTGNRQIHEDLAIPFFANHIRALTEGFDSKLADAGNPLVQQLRRHLC
jgi:hypothetical protein